MCGMFGISARVFLNKSELDIFQDLCVLNYFRGQHSYGILNITEVKGKRKTTKLANPEPILDHVSSDAFEGFISNGKHQAPHTLVGHTRQATVGSVTKENCHPFSKSNIIGFHNGTIVGMPFEKGSAKDKTDSEQLFDYINQEITNIKDDTGFDSKTVVTAITKVLSWLNKETDLMAYALQIYSRIDNKMYFIRNNQRPLNFLMSDYDTSNESMFWSSDINTVNFVKNNNFSSLTKITDFKKNNEDTLSSHLTFFENDIFQLNPFSIMSFEVGESFQKTMLFNNVKSEIGSEPTPSKRIDMDRISGDPRKQYSQSSQNYVSNNTVSRKTGSNLESSFTVGSKVSRKSLNKIGRKACSECGETFKMGVLRHNIDDVLVDTTRQKFVCHQCTTKKSHSFKSRNEGVILL